MKEKTKRPKASLTLTLALLTLVIACAREPQQKKELESGEVVLTLVGTVLPNQETEILSPIAATIEQVLVKPGEKVKAGVPLLKLDSAASRAEVARAEASLASAHANLAEAQTNTAIAQLQQKTGADISRYREAEIILENARARLERVYSLFAKEAVSKPELESAQDGYAEALLRFDTLEKKLGEEETARDTPAKIARAKYQAALAQVRQAEAELARAKSNLQQATVKAPIPGTVTEINVQQDQKVYEGRPTLGKIVDISKVRVRTNLSPGLLSLVRIGQEAKITVNTIPPTETRARIDQIQPVADPKTQSLGVFFTLPNPEFKFQPGFLAQAEITLEKSLSETTVTEKE